MPVWLWALDTLAIIVGLVVALLVTFAVRRRLLARRGGTFEMSVNRSSEPQSGGWTIGVGRYSANHLEWFRVFSLSGRPRYRFQRAELQVRNRREPLNQEVFAIHSGHVIVDCTSTVGVHQLAMSSRALTGLLSWLESSPPGHSVNNVL